eukprot:1175997-Prorocentrum_minimum.AAC.4
MKESFCAKPTFAIILRLAGGGKIKQGSSLSSVIVPKPGTLSSSLLQRRSFCSFRRARCFKLPTGVYWKSANPLKRYALSTRATTSACTVHSSSSSSASTSPARSGAVLAFPAGVPSSACRCPASSTVEARWSLETGCFRFRVILRSRFEVVGCTSPNTGCDSGSSGRKRSSRRGALLVRASAIAVTPPNVSTIRCTFFT